MFGLGGLIWWAGCFVCWYLWCFYAGYVRFGFELLYLRIVYDGYLDFVFMLIVLWYVILGFHVLFAGGLCLGVCGSARLFCGFACLLAGRCGFTVAY